MKLPLLLAATILSGAPAQAALPAAGPARATDSARRAGTDNEDAVRNGLRHYNLGRKGLAIEGYDPVAYFPEGGGAARKGTKRHALSHLGIIYWFSSKENLERFRANPDRYEPAYGGWGSFAMGMGEKVRVNPTAFIVQDGRLHLFYKGTFTDNQVKWREAPAEMAKRGDAFWLRICGQASAEDF